jgi:cell division protein FtsI (penicillin-binding protein 3)
MSKGFASNYRIALLAVGVFVCFAGLGSRLVTLHVVEREELLRTIVKVRQQTIEEKARRGDILDARGAVLATSRPRIVVGVDPWALLKEDEPKWPQLAALLGMSEFELRKTFATKYRTPAAATASATPATESSTELHLNLNVGNAAVPAAAAPDTNAPAKPMATAVAADDADSEQSIDERGRNRWIKLRDEVSESTFAAIEKLGIHGVYAPPRSFMRVYPHNELAAHIIGYVDHDQKPLAGIEAYADFYLRGQNGWRIGEKDGRNRELAQFRTRDVPRADGYSVSLSINTLVQDVIEQELAAIAQHYQPLKATIIVSDPRDGFILGLANYPTFNLSEYGRVPKSEMGRMRNIAVADVYEPGSVFKIVAASAALEEGLVGPGTTFNCTIDHIDYKGRTLKLPREDHHFEHPLSVAEIISHSSNRGAAQLAMLLGDERFERYARAFGFGHTLGFPVGGEVGGIFAPHEKWYPIDITRIPMGQSIAATALQMHQAMSTIASGGVLYRPQVIREIRDAHGEVVYRYDRADIARVISERTARTMATLLTGVASKEGTAPEAAIRINGVDYEVAGKTGTAQKYIDGRPSDRHHVASFIGFFPASRPQVAISVIVDDADAHAPNGVAYGKAVAAPSFKTIGEKLIPILDIRTATTPARINFVALTEGGRR